MKICKRCVMPSTRPRLSFREDEVCAACDWAEIKKTIDRNARQEESRQLCDSIRGGHLTREEAVNMVNQYDGKFMEDLIPSYLDYFQMTREEFDAVLDRHANEGLFEKVKAFGNPPSTSDNAYAVQ